MSKQVDLRDRNMLIDAMTTCLSSKVVSQNSDILAPIAVDAVLGIIDTDKAVNVDLNDIRIVKQLGGTVDDTELVPGIVFEKGGSSVVT
jgi:T-complex protein 1 subunit delta